MEQRKYKRIDKFSIAVGHISFWAMFALILWIASIVMEGLSQDASIGPGILGAMLVIGAAILAMNITWNLRIYLLKKNGYYDR
jgi:hypothetical protein